MKIKDGFKLRLRIVYTLIFLLAVIVLVRLFFIQVIRSDYYRNLADNQYITSSVDSYERGAIYFTNKDGTLISAATLKRGFLVAINPKILKNTDEVYRKISEIITIDKEEFFSHVRKKDDPYEVVAHRLSNEEAGKIQDLEIEGLNVFSETWRHYPGDNLASGILGFVGYKDDQLVGRYGIERQYEFNLKRDREEGIVNSFIAIFSGIKRIINNDLREGDIVLTIEPTVQSILEKSLKKTLEKYDAQMAGGLIIEPATGKILAMAAKPDFNPNSYGSVTDFSVFANPSVESIFEPGSIMKPLTIAAALDDESITSDTTYNDKGFLVIDKKRIENYDGKARGVVDMQEILNQSLNTGAVFVMKQLGKDNFREYLKKYGLGEKTGINLPGEVKGRISNVLDSPRDIEYATASFGQGIAVTPLAMASALATLANGGNLMKPYIVEAVRVKNGKDIEFKPKTRRVVLKKETSEEISRMLTVVVDNALMGGSYKLDRYTVAAKTGTAQYTKEGRKGYVKGQYIHTFFGYAPAFDAKFLTFLFLIKPQGVRYASHSLTEPFMNINNFLLNYYNIPPDR